MARRSSLVLCAVLACTLNDDAVGGDLAPPAGPVTPAMKTLNEVEPRIAINDANTPGNSSAVFRIISPGSYYLTGDVAAETGKGGITVVSSDVTIDLNGFTINVAPGEIGVGGTARVLRNGTIRGGAFGVILGQSGAIIEDLLVENAATTGIDTNGGTVIRRCQTASCDTGLSLAVDDVVEDCIVRSAVTAGIGGSASEVSIRRTIVDGVSTFGGVGIALGANSAVEDSTVRNADVGIRPAFRARIVGCVVEYCELVGIGTASASAQATEAVIERTTIVFSGTGSFGIDIQGDGARIDECTIRGGGIQVVGDGLRVHACDVSGSGLSAIFGHDSASVTDCTISNFGSFGVQVGNGSLVARCNIKSVAGEFYGIATGSDSLIERNVVDGVLLFGLLIETAARVRIVGNVINSDYIGIECGGECTIVGNQIRGGTHFAIEATGGDRNVINGNTLEGVTAAVRLSGVSENNTIVKNIFNAPALVLNEGGSWIGGVSSDPTTAGPWDNIQP